jgi:hypothetical protein
MSEMKKHWLEKANGSCLAGKVMLGGNDDVNNVEGALFYLLEAAENIALAMEEDTSPDMHESPEGRALIRRCDSCGIPTAVDLIGTAEHQREMQAIGETVYETTRAKAIFAWETKMGRCECRKNGNTAPARGEG